MIGEISGGNWAYKKVSVYISYIVRLFEAVSRQVDITRAYADRIGD